MQLYAELKVFLYSSVKFDFTWLKWVVKLRKWELYTSFMPAFHSLKCLFSLLGIQLQESSRTFDKKGRWNNRDEDWKTTNSLFKATFYLLSPSSHPTVPIGVPKQCTLGTRDFSSAVSGFCQVFIVASAYGRRRVGLRPTPKIPAAREKNLWYPG